MKTFQLGSHHFRESLRELLREFWFSHCSSPETPFREWDFSFRELVFELRELLRECPGTLPELRERPFRSESVFPEIGVVPRLLTLSLSVNLNLSVRALHVEKSREFFPLLIVEVRSTLPTSPVASQPFPSKRMLPSPPSKPPPHLPRTEHAPPRGCFQAHQPTPPHPVAA